jgi:hypothetical protein
MVGRAEVAPDQRAAVKLYNAAIDKFEAVLEEDPGLVIARYRCALAMLGLAAVLGTTAASSSSMNQSGDVGGGRRSAAAEEGSGSQRQLLTLLGDSAAYLSDVVAAAGAGGDLGLREAAEGALRQAQQRIEMARLGV